MFSINKNKLLLWLGILAVLLVIISYLKVRVMISPAVPSDYHLSFIEFLKTIF